MILWSFWNKKWFCIEKGNRKQIAFILIFSVWLVNSTKSLVTRCLSKLHNQYWFIRCSLFSWWHSIWIQQRSYRKCAICRRWYLRQLSFAILAIKFYIRLVNMVYSFERKMIMGFFFFWKIDCSHKGFPRKLISVILLSATITHDDYLQCSREKQMRNQSL